MPNDKPKLMERYFYILMGIAILTWALAFPFIRIGLEDLSPVNLTIMRFLVVCIAFILMILIFPKYFPKPEKRDIIPLFILGFFGVMVYHFGLNYGEQYVSPAAASLIIATIPVLVVIFAAIFLNEKITLKIAGGIILSLLGVVVISVYGTENSVLEIEYILAAVAVFIAALMGALYTVAGKKLLKRYSALPLSVYAMLLGSIGLIPFLSHSLVTQVAAMSINSWIAVLFLGIGSTVFGYVIWYMALEVKTASEVTVFLYFIPVLATIISYFLFDDVLTYFFFIGGFMVILGLVIVNRYSIKSKN